MINRVPRKYRQKYKKKTGWDEDLVVLAVKTVGSTALFFMAAIGMDAYRLFH